MKVIYILILAGLLASCNSQEKNTEETTSQQADKKKPSLINCYSYASEADTVTLTVIHAGDSIRGSLVYNLKEKDKNTGTIQGLMKGNILVADYTFLSEGIQSTRQIAFKFEGDSFVEGYGESFSQNDRVYFKNPDSLNFSSSVKLTEIVCQ